MSRIIYPLMMLLGWGLCMMYAFSSFALFSFLFIGAKVTKNSHTAKFSTLFYLVRSYTHT